MATESNVLNQHDDESGLLQDVLSKLNEYGVNEKDSWIFGHAIASWAFEYAKSSGGIEGLRGVEILRNGEVIALSGLVNYAEQDLALGNKELSAKTIALTLLSFMSSKAGMTLGRTIAGMALGGVVAISGAGIVAGVVAGFTADYLANLAWDTWIGPNVRVDRDETQDTYSFVVNGKLSDFLKPRGWIAQGIEGTAEIIADFLPFIGSSTASNVWEKFDVNP